MKQKICLKKLNGVLIPSTSSFADSSRLTSTFMASLMSQGLILTKPLYTALKTLPEEDFLKLSSEVLAEIRNFKGADVSYQPMYPNFPQQVMESSHLELFLNAITHYWTNGFWKPEYAKLPRQFAFEYLKFKELDLVTEKQFKAVFTQLLSSQDSLSAEDKEIIEWFMKNESNLAFPESIPFKETMCLVAGMFFQAKKDITPFIKTATDLLRLMTYLNGGDISLAENTKFKSLPRSQRKVLSQLLEKVATEEDIHRHRNKWVRLFHNLHVGEYSSKLFELAKKFRNNQPIETFNSQIHESFKRHNLLRAIVLLKQRPGEFARRLDHLLRFFKDSQEQITKAFLEVAEDLPTRIITQVLGHLDNRGYNCSRNNVAKRVVFPKGNTQRAQLINSLDSKDIDPSILGKLSNGLEFVLHNRFSKLPSLGKVWIDPRLKECPIPSQQRSASTGLFNVARGTRLEFGDKTKNTLRFFIHWIGQDLDLSASLHDENFKLIEYISYTHLRSQAYQSCHSGDITYAPAPNGGCEFIDITIDAAAKYGARYVAMNVFVFRGPTFAEHETAYAGWMTRSAPKSNEIFDSKTVEQKIDLRSKSKNVIPVVFDLVERKAIWCDLSTPQRAFQSPNSWGGNNIENNKAPIEQTLKAIVEARSKLSLHSLFTFHAQARGQIVTDKAEAKTIFALDGGITPFQINLISSEFLS